MFDKIMKNFTAIGLLILVFGFGQTMNAQVCTPAPVGLVSWWNADGNALDSRSRSNGTLQNGAGFTAGQVGQAFNFNGANAVSVADTPSLDFGTNADLSVEAWIRTADSASVRVIADKRFLDGGVVIGYALFLRDNGIGFQLADGINSNYEVFDLGNFSINIRDGNFHHVAATVDRDSTTGGKLFVDNVLVLTFNPTDQAICRTTSRYASA